ncbi:MAG: gliding motility protein GldC [Cytophagales bacterium]|nr:gliding motility protein GldC [Cytophagales bacterium]
MTEKEIKLKITLDDNNIPEKLSWKATDSASQEPQPVKAFSLNMWEGQKNETLRIDLWDKEINTLEMKRFCIDTMGGMAQSLLSATGDEYMANEMKALCEKFVAHVHRQMEEGKQ